MKDAESSLVLTENKMQLDTDRQTPLFENVLIGTVMLRGNSSRTYVLSEVDVRVLVENTL